MKILSEKNKRQSQKQEQRDFYKNFNKIAKTLLKDQEGDDTEGDQEAEQGVETKDQESSAKGGSQAILSKMKDAYNNPRSTPGALVNLAKQLIYAYEEGK